MLNVVQTFFFFFLKFTLECYRTRMILNRESTTLVEPMNKTMELKISFSLN